MNNHLLNLKFEDIYMAEPTLKIIKRLFAHSGNKCAFPECKTDLVEANGNGTVLGEICHIKARSPKGPRFDNGQTEQERNAYDNLILLCANHHKLVDDNANIFSVSVLSEMKKSHEERMTRGEKEEDIFFAKKLINNTQFIENKGNLIINSPGSTQISQLNVTNKKAKIVVLPPSGSIGHDVALTAYIQHLIRRYNEYASADTSRKRKFNYGVLSKNIDDRFGSAWRQLPVEKSPDVIKYIQYRINRTRIAKINRGKGYKAYSTLDEWLAKYDI